jgi:branched-chain amino acid transport system ATP-binding protein
MKPLLFLHGIGLRFGGLTVLENLDIQVRKGSRCGLIGPNGAGKTTIFNLLSGVYRADAGEILLDDEPIDDIPLDGRIHLGIGRTFQNLRLMKHLTVLENIMLGQHHLINSWSRILAPLGSAWNRQWHDEAVDIANALGLGGIVGRLWRAEAHRGRARAGRASAAFAPR